jgi:hypothetical protein
MWPATDLRAETSDSPLAALDRLAAEATRVTRVLPALVAKNAPAERQRLTQAVAAGETPVPHWQIERRPIDAGLHRALASGRRLVDMARGEGLADLYAHRLEELELDLAMMEGLGRAAIVRPLALRRYGSGAQRVEHRGRMQTLAEVAQQILAITPPENEPRDLPADGGPCSMAGAMRVAVIAAELEVEVRIEPRLGAGAATGDRTVFVASRRFGRRECVRLVAHEVLGHAVAAANGAHHPLRIAETGTAGSFADQEGVAIALEEAAGTLDAARWRTLAARVVATDRMHAGASFGETALSMHRDLGLPADLAVVTAERAYRGGGVARDAGYLAGYLRVRTALEREQVTLDELRQGRVSVDAVPVLRALRFEAPHRPDTMAVLTRVRAALSA